MKHNESIEARNRLEVSAELDDLPKGWWRPIAADILSVCEWTHHWEDTADEIGAIIRERDKLRRDLANAEETAKVWEHGVGRALYGDDWPGDLAAGPSDMIPLIAPLPKVPYEEDAW